MSYVTNGYLVRGLIAATESQNHPDFSDAESYLKSFRAMEDKFFSSVHPQVDIGLAMSEVSIAGDTTPNIFTVHGCRHIADLIKSLDKLAKAISEDPGGELTVLERYILLCAAHVHDAANVQKRESHPERCSAILEDPEYRSLFVSPTVVQSIYSVASVHGGKHEIHGKDTLRTLDVDNSESPRLPLLAVLLRLGDELSENPDRVPGLVAKNHEHSPESQLAFTYARCFCKFEFRKDNLYIFFNVYPSQANFITKVNGQDVHFYDFLEGKLNVIDREARYCSQYGRPAFNVAKISITVRIYEKELPSRVKDTVHFSWDLFRGYPGEPESICARSPELCANGQTSLKSCFMPPNKDATFSGQTSTLELSK